MAAALPQWWALIGSRLEWEICPGAGAKWEICPRHLYFGPGPAPGIHSRKREQKNYNVN